jgi:hypothetical protein
MTSHDQLIKNFLSGRHDNWNDKKGNSMTIEEKDNHTTIVGYGHALYCLKYGGTVVLFNSWRGKSRTTSKHLTQIETKAKSDEHINLVKVNDQDRPHKDTSKAKLEQVMCDYCKVQPTKKKNKQNGLRVCDKTKCNRKMAKGENPKKVQPVL